MPKSSAPGLSKTRFVAGWQCHNALWWRVHEPDAPELQVGPALQDLFDQGSEVGRLARERFPGGVLIDLPHDAVDARATATRAAIEAGAPAVFEASFVADRVFVAVDVLERNGDGFNLIEVKSSTRVKDEHIPDAAVQIHVVRQNGLDVRCVELMHLNKEYRHPGHGDLFARDDVTARVLDMLDQIPSEVAAQIAMLAGDFPDVPIGDQCTTFSDCPFRRRCWPDAVDHVLQLSGKGVRKALELMAEGYHRIQDLPDDMKLSEVNRRQRLALQTGGMAVEPELPEALAALESPVGFLDFETVGRAIPVWDGLAPWGSVPTQFSYHEEANGGYRHTEWLADGPNDPREEIAEKLVAACRNARHIVVYTSFEATQLRQLQDAVPRLADELAHIERRLFDLHKVVKAHVYHPAFAGSFSIKTVLPALVPELGYDDLAVAEGQEASVLIARLMLRGDAMSREERDRLRIDLLAYCERDTWAMVKLVERLREIAATVGAKAGGPTAAGPPRNAN
jgi:predicted RecB family nuclease